MINECQDYIRRVFFYTQCKQKTSKLLIGRKRGYIKQNKIYMTEVKIITMKKGKATENGDISFILMNVF